MKRRILAIALIIVFALGMTACKSSSDKPAHDSKEEKTEEKGADDYAMRIPLTGIMCEAPTSVAYLLGYFDDEGLKYETYKTDGTTNYDTMLSGQNDVIFGLLPTMVQRMASGFKMDVVMGAHYGCINMVVSKDSGITSVDDLKGKKIGVPGLGSDPCVMLQRVLKAHNIGASADNMEVQIMAFEDADLQAAMEEGQIDAMISWDPFATQVAEQDGAAMIYQQAKDELTKDEYCCLIGLREEFVKEHPESALAYCKAMQKACDYIAKNPEEAAKLIIDNDLCGCDDVELTTQLLDSYKYEAQTQAAKLSFQTCTQDLMDLKIIDIDQTAEEFTNNAFNTIEGFDCK